MLKSYHRILNAVSNEPWAIHPKKAMAILHFLELKSSGAKANGHNDEGTDTSKLAERFTPAQDRKIAGTPGSIMVLPLQDVISHRANLLDDFSGGTSVENFSKQFMGAINNQDIKVIILDVNSPGGAVSGVPELSKMIFDARDKKSIIAQVDADAFSAAYWIATAAQEIVVTPSGEVGSVGVYTMHEDLSKYYEEAGIKETFISAGQFKVEGNPFEPLSEEARAAIQTRVDDYYSMFIADVARNRGVSKAEVEKNFGQGRVVGAQDAISLKMADRIGTMQDTLARFGANMYPSSTRNKSQPVERMTREAKLQRAKGE